MHRANTCTNAPIPIKKSLAYHTTRQQAEEEATAVHKQRVANKTDYQAVAGVLMRLQRQVRASVPQWRATREANAAAADEGKRRATAGYRQTRSMTASTSRAKNGRAGGNNGVGGGSASRSVEGRGVVGGGGGGDSGGAGVDGGGGGGDDGGGGGGNGGDDGDGGGGDDGGGGACGGLMQQGRNGSQGTSSRYEDEEAEVSGHLVERGKRNRGGTVTEG